MFKAPPLFSIIIPELGFTDENIGWVMSMFSIIGLVMAFPAGAILAKLGIKKSLIITAASLAIGSAMGGKKAGNAAEAVLQSRDSEEKR